MALSKPICEQNITLITKPEQSGKTFIMLEEISKLLKRNKYTINIIMCDNNLLLISQTSVRCEQKELGYYELSSKIKNIDYNSICAKTITKNKPIILCNNKTRKDDINKMVKWYLNLTQHNIKYNINIWIDEADKGFLSIKKDIFPIVNQSNLINIYLLTATPNKIINECEEIKVFPLKESILSTYHGWNDNIIIKIKDNFNKLIDFINNILENNKKEIKKDTRWFIPGLIWKKNTYRN